MKANSIALTDTDRATLRGWMNAHSGEQRLAFRARIILSLAEGLSNEQTAQRHSTRAATVSKWRVRFAQRGLDGLSDAPRSGKPASYDAQTERRILAALDENPPEGHARWNGPLLAEKLKDISKHHIWRVLRRHKIVLERRRS
jgi:transposase